MYASDDESEDSDYVYVEDEGRTSEEDSGSDTEDDDESDEETDDDDNANIGEDEVSATSDPPSSVPSRAHSADVQEDESSLALQLDDMYLDQLADVSLEGGAENAPGARKFVSATNHTGNDV